MVITTIFFILSVYLLNVSIISNKERGTVTEQETNLSEES